MNLLITILIVLIVSVVLQTVFMVLQTIQNTRRQEMVQELGVIKNVAEEVDRFKKLFENVKAKGILGERVLDSILGQFLTAGQYDRDVKIKGGTVEFCVKIPSSEDVYKYVWLPIDSKFRLADYQQLIEAYDIDATQDADSLKSIIVARKKALKSRILDEAKKIRKYIDTPKTTPFAIMFLPNDKMFIEVLNIEGLLEDVHTQNILITGPSTLAAFLSSLQMGFKCVALEKRTGDILSLYHTVKNGIDEFGDVLQKVRSSLEVAEKKVQDAEKSVHGFQKKMYKIETFVCDGPLVEDAEPSISIDSDSGNDDNISDGGE